MIEVLANATTSPSDQGPLRPLVLAVGYAMAAVAAILLAVARGRRKWEPPDKDLPRATDKVGVLVSAAVLVASYFWLQGREQVRSATILLFIAVGLLLLFYFTYSFLSREFLVSVPIGWDAQKEVVTERTIGGLLTPYAREKKREHRVSTDKLILGWGDDISSMWIWGSRGIIAACINLVYILWIASMVVTAGAMGMLVMLLGTR